MKRKHKRWLWPPLLLATLICLSGAECQEDAPPEDTSLIRDVDRRHIPPIDTDEECLENESCEAWASSPWMQDISDSTLEGFISIEPGETVRILHNLGRQPLEVVTYVTFSETSEMLMPASGNSSEIWEVTDEHIMVRNGSGGSFFYRFLLR